MKPLVVEAALDLCDEIIQMGEQMGEQNTPETKKPRSAGLFRMNLAEA